MKSFGRISPILVAAFALIACQPLAENTIRYGDNEIRRGEDSDGRASVAGLEVAAMLSSTSVGAVRSSHETGIVALQSFNSAGVFINTCGGILIRPDVVLTAAHCFDRRLSPSTVFTRVLRVNDIRDVPMNTRAERRILRPVLHPLYDSMGAVAAGVRQPSYDHDLAVVFLDSSFEGEFHPVSLAKVRETLRPSAKLVSYGYGKSVDYGDAQNPAAKRTYTLQRGHLTVSDKILGDRVLTRASSPSSVCYGDSGGPVFEVSGRGPPRLVAINSATNGKQLVSVATLRLCRGESVLQPIGPQREWIEATLRAAGK